MTSRRADDATRGASLEDLLRTVQRATALGIRTIIPGRVLSYDATLNIALVEVGTRSVVDADSPYAQARLTAKGATLEKDGARVDAVLTPSAVKVPVLWPGGSDAMLTFPVTEGLRGVLLVLDRNPSSWLTTGKAAAPLTSWTHAVSDSVFLPRWPVPYFEGPQAIPDPTSVVLQSTTAPIKLGDGTATQGVARLGDEVTLHPSVVAWMAAVTSAFAAIGVTLPTVTSYTGTVTQASTKVYSQ